MPLHDTSRRRFIRNGALLALSAPLWNRALAAGTPGAGVPADATPTVRLNWLERQPP
ncbi:hypothetical protein HLB26_22070, partial [Dickeya dadantii]|nr:hypothetical protein [Dickeya dadantii]